MCALFCWDFCSNIERPGPILFLGNIPESEEEKDMSTLRQRMTEAMILRVFPSEHKRLT